MVNHYCGKLEKNQAVYDRLGRELLDLHAQTISTAHAIYQAYTAKVQEYDPTQQHRIPAGNLNWTPITVLRELEIPVSSEAGKLARRILSRKNYGAYHPLVKRWLAYVIVALKSPDNENKVEEHVEVLKEINRFVEIVDYNDAPMVKRLLAELDYKKPTDKIYQEVLLQTM